MKNPTLYWFIAENLDFRLAAETLLPCIRRDFLQLAV